MNTASRRKVLPPQGQETERIVEALESLRIGDVHWRQGRALSHVATDVEDVCRQAANTFLMENGALPAVFPSLVRLESEVVSMTAGLLHGGEDVVGNVTTGRTENAFLVVKAARGLAATTKPKLTQPEMVVPSTAHPSFRKAASYLSVKPVVVPHDGIDYRVDVKAVIKALNERTILVVGSAPTPTQGVVDPIPELAAAASKHGVPCHVDASLGGFFLPFLAELGEPVPPFDLSIDGVTSIAVDLDGYGCSIPGASVLLHASGSIRRHQYHVVPDWSGGVHAAPTLLDARPGGPIAAAWAVMHKLGFEGYRESVHAIMAATREIMRGITAIDGLEVLGQPSMSVFAVGSRRHNVFEISERLASRGWYVERQMAPASLLFTITKAHTQAVDQLLEDVRDAAQASTQEPVERLIDRTKGLLLNTATRFLPRKIISSVASIAGDLLGIATNELAISTVPLHGIKPAMPHAGDIEEAAMRALDDLQYFSDTLETPTEHSQNLDGSPT